MSGRLSVWVAGLLCAVVGIFAFAGIASAGGLPNGRYYEQVTPEEKYGSEVYQPESVGGNFEYQAEHKYSVDTRTEYTFQAAADGSGIAYVAGPTVGGNENEGFDGGNEYLATRSADGAWSQRVLSPEGHPSTIFQAFSPDLTTAFVNSVEPLSVLAPGFGEPPVGEGDYDVLYSVSTAGGEYSPLFSTEPPYRSMEKFGTVPGTYDRPKAEANSHRGNHSGFLSLEGASDNGVHLLFAANDALTSASEGRPAAEGGPVAEFESKNNLYDSVKGTLGLVNILPDGTTHANAMFGGEATIQRNNTSISCATCSGQRVISADGSRIFWTDLSTGHIYVRENGTSTVEISPVGKYQTASSDGSVAFYTNGNLYAYDVESGQTNDLTPGVNVEKVLGTSESGDYVYYVASGNQVLLWHDGVSTSIPISAPKIPEVRSAEVTPDGHSIVFTMRELVSSSEEQMRVYVYDADSNRVYCASCMSDKTALRDAFGSTLPPTNSESVYQPRWISTNGARIFFISVDGLVPQDTNELTDVYEWERPGTSGCTESAGCVYLLSGGTSTDNSLFLDASENGEDVFITTRSNLIGSDEDGLYDVYDVRIGNPPPVPPACTGTGCQGVPSPAPIFATPSSVTFEGVGNFAAPARETKARSKPQHKKTSKRKTKTKHKKKKSQAKKSGRKAHSRKRSSSKGGRS